MCILLHDALLKSRDHFVLILQSLVLLLQLLALLLDHAILLIEASLLPLHLGLERFHARLEGYDLGDQVFLRAFSFLLGCLNVPDLSLQRIVPLIACLTVLIRLHFVLI